VSVNRSRTDARIREHQYRWRHPSSQRERADAADADAADADEADADEADENQDSRSDRNRDHRPTSAPVSHFRAAAHNRFHT
jgi:hypothetical protein